MAGITFTCAAAIAVFATGLTACNRGTTCKSEVTQGSGTFRGAVTGARSEVELRREATRLACAELCAAGSAKSEGCTARCAVDAEAGKIGVRTTCAKEGSSR